MRRARGLALMLLVAGCGAAGGGTPADLPPPPPARTVAPVRTALPARAQPGRPGWRVARVIPDAPLLPAREVVAAAGDTLEAVARAAGLSAGALAAANGLAAPYALTTGQTLRVPAGRWHVVKPGETLSAIARAYRAGFAAVSRANGARAPYALEVGDRVLIPAMPAPAPRLPVPVPATVEGRASAYNLDIERLLGKEPTRKVGPRSPSALRAPPPGGEEDHHPTPLGEVAAKPTEGTGPRTLPQAEAPAMRLDWPLNGRILSPFGAKPGGRFNDGINIAAIAGAQVRAAADGTVAYAGTGVAAFGGLILIRHEGGWLTAYAHCEALLVAKGDTVRRGQPIARAGATGEVDAPQLHFEVRRGRVPVDPMRLLPAR